MQPASLCMWSEARVFCNVCHSEVWDRQGYAGKQGVRPLPCGEHLLPMQKEPVGAETGACPGQAQGHSRMIACTLPDCWESHVIGLTAPRQLSAQASSYSNRAAGAECLLRCVRCPLPAPSSLVDRNQYVVAPSGRPWQLPFKVCTHVYQASSASTRAARTATSWSLR